MIVPIYIEISMFVFFIIIFILSLYGFYIYIYEPSYKIYMDLQSPPPREGEVKEILIVPKQRKKKITIGSLTSDIALRLKGIEDRHLEITIQKDKDLEEYKITINPLAKDKVLWKAPHTKNVVVLNEPDTFEGRELIGHPAYIRIVGLMQRNRPIHYVEFELSVKFIIDNSGEERMKFILKLTKIYPGIDLKSRNKKGIYSFGKLKTEDLEQINV